MGLIKKDFARKSGLRDARLIIIACEGSETEPRYFRTLRETFQQSRLHIEILYRQDFSIEPTSSHAKYVMELLNRFKKHYHLKKDDELWLILDRDSGNFSAAQLSETAQLCLQKKYNLAVSNPTFEFWLLLHFENVANLPEEEQAEILANEKISTRKRLIDKRLENYLGSYDKANYAVEKFMDITMITFAIQNAKLFPLEEDKRWHEGLGTEVYLLVENICKALIEK